MERQTASTLSMDFLQTNGVHEAVLVVMCKFGATNWVSNVLRLSLASWQVLIILAI